VDDMTPKFSPYERIAAACQSGKGVRLSWEECCEMYQGDTTFKAVADNQRFARREAELARRQSAKSESPS
jgi:hypothetical protein